MLLCSDLKVHFVISAYYFNDIYSRYLHSKHNSQCSVQSNVAFVSYVRFTVSYCGKGYYVGISNVDIQ